jgi:hypothetical protein
VAGTRRTNRGLLGLALALLGLSGSLAYVLAHDAVGSDAAALAQAPIGEDAAIRGSFAPYFPSPAALDPRWAPVEAVLANHTYVLLASDPSVVLLVTDAAPSAGNLADSIVHGTVALRMPHPDASGRTLVVLQVSGWDQPIVFG